MSIMFENGDIDQRSAYDRLQWTETTCDTCHGVILASERRHDNDGDVVCDECFDTPPTVRQRAHAHAAKYPEKLTVQEFLIWWAHTWEDTDKIVLANMLDQLTDEGRETIAIVTRALTWVERPPV